MKNGPVTADDVQRLSRFAVGLAKLKVQKADREDIVGELELAALKSLKRFPNMDRAQFTTYFLSFAVKEAKRLASELNAWRVGELELFSEVHESIANLPGGVCHYQEPAQSRDEQIAIAVYINGETQEECARRMGLSRRTIIRACQSFIATCDNSGS